jgi:hypothetical protein
MNFLPADLMRLGTSSSDASGRINLKSGRGHPEPLIHKLTHQIKRLKRRIGNIPFAVLTGTQELGHGGLNRLKGHWKPVSY